MLKSSPIIYRARHLSDRHFYDYIWYHETDSFLRTTYAKSKIRILRHWSRPEFLEISILSYVYSSKKKVLYDWTIIWGYFPVILCLFHFTKKKVRACHIVGPCGMFIWELWTKRVSIFACESNYNEKLFITKGSCPVQKSSRS